MTSSFVDENFDNEFESQVSSPGKFDPSGNEKEYYDEEEDSMDPGKVELFESENLAPDAEYSDEEVDSEDEEAVTDAEEDDEKKDVGFDKEVSRNGVSASVEENPSQDDRRYNDKPPEEEEPESTEHWQRASMVNRRHASSYHSPIAGSNNGLKADVLNEDLINTLTCMIKTKRYLRVTQGIYRNRIKSDNSHMRGFRNPADVQSAWAYLHRRFQTLQDYSDDQDGNAQKCLRLVRNALKDFDVDEIQRREIKSVGELLMGMITLKDGYLKSWSANEKRMTRHSEVLYRIQDIDALKAVYYFLLDNIVELDSYLMKFDVKLEECLNVLGLVVEDDDELLRMRSHIEQKAPLTPAPPKVGSSVKSSRPQRKHYGLPHHVVRQFIPAPPSSPPHRHRPRPQESGQPTPQRGRSTTRNAKHETIESVTSQITPSPPSTPVRWHRSRSSAQKAIVPSDVSKKGLPPVPGHVIDPSRIAPPSKFKIFSEKLPSFDAKSSGYGSCVKRRQVQQRDVVKREKIKWPVFKTQNEDAKVDVETRIIQEFDIKKRSIKGLVKPNLIRKDLINLADPTVRPRGSKAAATQSQLTDSRPTQVGHQAEPRVRGSKATPVRRLQPIQPRDSKPPLADNQTVRRGGRIPVLTGTQWQSKFQRLPNIPTAQSTTKGTRHILPEPPKTPRRRGPFPHKRHVTVIEGALPRQW